MRQLPQQKCANCHNRIEKQQSLTILFTWYSIKYIIFASEIKNEILWKNIKQELSKIDTDKMKSPSFKMVLTGVGKYAYQRPQDGVYVVPVGCLRD